MLRMRPADFLGMSGSFRRPPVLAGGFLYAVSIDGSVHQISPRTGAKSRELAHFQLGSVGFNRVAVSNIATRTGSLRGWVLLGIGPDGIAAVSLVSGAMEILYKAPFPEELAANRSEADSTGFKGIASTSEFCAFAIKRSPDEYALALKYLADSRPPEQLLLLNGRDVAGPALCGRSLLLCTDRQVGVYDRDTGAAFVKNLPRRFAPLLSPSSPALTVPPGGMPMAIETSATGERAICVAGMQDSRSGVLHVRFKGDDTFQELPRGSSFSTNADGSVCLAQPGETLLMHADETRRYPTRAQPGMPAFYDDPYLCTFAEADFAGQHRLAVVRGGRRLDLPFTDAKCDRNSCCGAYVLEGDVLVSYLDVLAAEDEPGLRFAHFEAVSN